MLLGLQPVAPRVALTICTMPPSPSVVIIVRHGARLDAADKTWHLTSPTPYDPPLTYGGWTQSKALGTRIASLLHARGESADDGVEANGTNNAVDDLDFGPLDGPTELKNPTKAHRTTKRKHKIIIHSSPYLRCVQTSIAISAGIAQFQPSQDSAGKRSNSPRGRMGTNLRSGSPRPRAAESTSPALTSILELEDHPTLNVFRKSLRRKALEKTTLRIDAFLGEWLSPDYFEDITPPPNSTMMVAGAKADLLRRGEYVEVQQNVNTNKGHFPGGWVKGNGLYTTQNKPIQTEDGALTDLGSLAQVLPLHNRSSSQGSAGNVGNRASHRGAQSISTSNKVASNIYDPPVPSYAVSTADPIPRGYVAHARDACVDADYQWDSMRAPQEWGDGGEYGDEWSTMHKRFRKGLAGMMAWYNEHGCGGPQDKIHEAIGASSEDDHEDDGDLVLILVTHGAGCNALLGAISNQPVLLDVGMASLSMAVRKESGINKSPSPPLPSTRRSSVMDMGMSEEYEMKILASLDHLRPGVDPAKLSQTPSPALLANPSEYRRRYNSSTGTNSPIDSPFTLPEPIRGVNSALGSIRRSSTSGSSTSSRLFSSSTIQNATTMGLWSKALSNVDGSSEVSGSPGNDLVLNFGDVKPSTPLAKTVSKGSENDEVAPLPQSLGKPTTHHGLWGPAPSGARNERERGPKRRWTISERDA
ncbi:uncharacterized protein K441DRAFT_625823 [Cenococcum geophilum 1.58]|uniref:uncharacterized protein n=1 Tax=Cenococcum geophilum 1.58 TaxID=794803 RepID=UPI00358FCC7E|nr:hypothetical protein K441DRAFT_625823 [Cenococcum geophilum 1.58]